MIIGFDAKRAFNNTAGLGNFSRSTIVALASQDLNDQFYLFHPGNRKPRFIIPDNSTEIQPNNIFWKTFKSAWRSLHTSSLVKELKLDIYHGLSHELPFGIEKTGAKSIVTIHDLIFLRYPEYFRKVDRLIYNRKFRHACMVADRIHAISEQTKHDLIEFFSVPEEKIVVIYQAINPLFFQSSTEEQKIAVRNKYELPEQFLLSVGTIEPRKNLTNLLEGMVSAKIKLPLVVVGKPSSYIKKVQELIARHSSFLNVIFLSGVDDVELHVLYQSATIMIYPSIFEGFGLPVAEAQASGCPVITSNTSSMPEVGGDAAIYINPQKPVEIGKAIESLGSNQELRDLIIEKGKMNAQRFTSENFAKQLKQLYNTILND